MGPPRLPAEFEEFFRLATGNAPYEYQRLLAESTPSVLEVPTGCGKTQGLLASWLHRRLIGGDAPRRLVYALPMRALVEQTRDVATSVRERLGVSLEDLPIHVLMGGEAPTDWREHPERSQILIGTIDVLLSRALNRGYGESRFAWPVSFGLLNADCRWVLDEVQLMGPARTTSAQLDGLRRALGTTIPCETTWMSATIDREALLTIDRPELGEALTLPGADRDGPLGARLNASKRVVRAELAAEKPADVPAAIADQVAAKHLAGTRSIVVVNTVARAQETAKALQKRLEGGDRGPEVVLLHSRYRPPEREAHTRRALGEVADGGTIVVATQVIEAGVDVSARLLATETAPFSSVVQRLGRCNRAGEFDAANVLWLDQGPYVGASAQSTAAPYLPEDLNAARQALEGLVGKSASPAALGRLSVSEHREELAVLRKRDLLDLFDTAPDISGLDVDVSRFVREVAERSVPVFFREIESDGERRAATEGQPSALREEIVEGPIAELRKALTGAGRRRAWSLDHVEGEWLPARADTLVPGMPVMLDAAEGGYDELGWNPRSRSYVDPVETDGSPKREPEAIGRDPESTDEGWIELSDHLEAAHNEASGLLAELNDADITRDAVGAVGAAAALHDIGKAHSVFQDRLHSLASDDERGSLEGVVLAKSPRDRRGGRYKRPYFRHELASALALRSSRDGLAMADGTDPDLTIYLVGSHHGKVRLSIRPAPDERPPNDAPEASRFALGIAEGDELPAVATPLGEVASTTLALSCMELGDERSWYATASRLRDDPRLGPFRLAFLEALVRIADWRASG